MGVAVEIYPIKWRLYSAIQELDAGNIDEVKNYLSEIAREMNLAQLANRPLHPIAIDPQVSASDDNLEIYPSPEVAENIHDHASEIWVETEELLTICHLFQQSVLRSRTLWGKHAAVEVALEPVLGTQEVFDRRIRNLRDHGKAICQLLDAA